MGEGWTITYFPWQTGKQTVIGRFKTTKEKDDFLDKIYQPDSGYLEEELMSISVINDINYVLSN